MASTYEQERQSLRQAELALVQQREAVAAMRRELPPGPVAPAYVFGSDDGVVSLDQLCSGDRPLIAYHFMFGGQQAAPCPMCSMWADGWNAIAQHLATRVDLALVTNASVVENGDLAAERGWQHLRWLSAAETDFKLDYGSCDANGNQSPFFTVFERDGADVRLSYSGGAHIDEDQWRGVDLLSPVWHFLDLTRPGRGDWMPSL